MNRKKEAVAPPAAPLICCQCDAPGPIDREQAEAEGWRSVGYVSDPLFSYALPICPECVSTHSERPQPAAVGR
jgi:hypothetical protein